MRPLSNQSASTFLPHGVAAAAGLAVESAANRAHGKRKDRNERAEKARGCHERDLMGADGSPGQGVFRRGVSGWCVESKRSVRRSQTIPSPPAGQTEAAASVARHGFGVGALHPGVRLRCSRLRRARRRDPGRRDVRRRRIRRRRDASPRWCRRRGARGRARRRRVRSRSGSARRALGAAADRRCCSSHAVDRRDDGLVDRRRPQLGRVQQGGRPTARFSGSAWCSRPSGADSVRGSPRRRSRSSSARRSSTRSSRRPFPRSIPRETASRGCASRSSTGTRLRCSRTSRSCSASGSARSVRIEAPFACSGRCSSTSPRSRCC